MTAYTNAVTNIVKQCQDAALRYGFDHVFLEGTRRMAECQVNFFAITASCWACDSSKQFCNYYGGGQVPSNATCSSAIYSGLPFNSSGYSRIYQLPTLPQCTTSGCRYCKTASNTYLKVIQVYRATPKGTYATASLEPYVGANPETKTFYDPAYPNGIASSMFDNCPGSNGTGLPGPCIH